MSIFRLLKLGVLLTCLFAVASRSQAQTQIQQAGELVLRPGDHLRITVASNDKNLSGEIEVGPDGALRHPIYNQLKLASVPLPLLKDTIASFLRRFERDPHLDVEPLFKATILGEVRTPNIYFLAPGTIVSDAIAHAGGLTDRADPARVTILRDGHRLSTSLNGAAGNPALTILSGDQISVAQSRNVFGSMIPVIGVAVSVISLIILSQR
jgi:protein involved in polysaccharide export with SLBB domain